jgi:hypothetical protein
VYRRSLFRPLSQEVALRRKAVRKDLAVHVSLSSDSLVKQPGNHRDSPPPHLEGVAEAQVIRTKLGCLVTPLVRSFAGAPSRRKVGGAPSWGLYRGASRPLSTDNLNEFHHANALWTAPSEYACCRDFEARKSSAAGSDPNAERSSRLQQFRNAGAVFNLMVGDGSAARLGECRVGRWSGLSYRHDAALAPYSCSVVCCGERPVITIRFRSTAASSR